VSRSGDIESPATVSATGPWANRGRRHLIALVALVLALLAVAAAFDIVTASPRFCGSCHAMDARFASWSESPHVVVSCVGCHETPRPWYARPATLVERGRLLIRDMRWRLVGRPEVSEGELSTDTRTMDDSVCLRCHDPNRPATSGFRILIDHAQHAERNGSCVSCHVDTAHPHGVSVPITLMEQCFTCHGTFEMSEAKAECGVCHPSGYELRPDSHKEAAWPKEHGGVALGEPRQCAMCHTDKSCTDCHGVEMPHPETWARGRKGHASVAERQRDVCARCHTEKPDLCSMCHHRSYDPSKGNWIRQHFIEVRRRGTTYCFECHSPVYCVECHVR
jgi:cytochrome c nitrite reductase small subunit